MSKLSRDFEVLRELAKTKAQIAALPVQQQTKDAWRALNRLKPIRPMVIIDQCPWNELNIDGALDLHCENEFLREIEQQLRRELLAWRYFPADMVVEPYIKIDRVIHGMQLIEPQEDTKAWDPANQIVGHAYHDLFKTEEDIEKKIPMPRVWVDEDKTERRLAMAHEAFDGILDVVAGGVTPYLAIWDRIVERHGVENSLIDIIDRPEFMHRLVNRLVAFYQSLTDQLEQLGLFDDHQPTIHCSGAYTDELPKEGYTPGKPRACDTWTCGMAQIFATVSPAVHDEFEIQPLQPLLERYGLVYYGCCEPLHDRIHLVRKIKNVRKISVSPWADVDIAAEQIGSDYVMSCKPTPALLAVTSLDGDAVKKYIRHVMDICKQNNTPVEFILKDISTVRYKPENLIEWEKIATSCVKG